MQIEVIIVLSGIIVSAIGTYIRLVNSEKLSDALPINMELLPYAVIASNDMYYLTVKNQSDYPIYKALFNVELSGKTISQNSECLNPIKKQQVIGHFKLDKNISLKDVTLSIMYYNADDTNYKTTYHHFNSNGDTYLQHVSENI